MDTEALKKMILDNLKDLRRFAYSLTNDLSDADDLTQVVVERLLSKPMPENVMPLSWMFRVCKNAWIDELRFRKVRNVDDNVELTQIAAVNNRDQMDDTDDSQRQRLRAAMTELPETYRDVIALIIVSGLSYAETAEVLEVPIGTVMSRVARAREKLAHKLKKGDEVQK